MDRLLFHGGVGGLKVGDVVASGMAEHRYVPGCKHCEAQRDNTEVALDPPTPDGWVYASSDRPYARYYASRAVKGWLYRVRLEGDVEPSVEDHPNFPTWRARRAVVVQVLERGVVLTMRERLKLWKRWGGTEPKFRQMIRSLLAEAT